MTVKILRWQLLAMGVSALALAVWIILTMMTLQNGDLDRRMTYFAEILAETASAEPDRAKMAGRLQAVERVFVKGVIESLGYVTGYTATYRVLDAESRVLYESPNAAPTAISVPDGLSEQWAQGDAYRVVKVHSADRNVSVVLAESARTRRMAVLPMLRIIGLGQVLIFIACLIASTWAARRGLAPLRHLRDSVAGRAPGDLRPIPVGQSFAELDPLIEEMNSLLAREAQRLETERSFLADAAHELRTPLAAIAAQAHLVLRADAPEVRERARRQLHLGVERVSHLLKQLLTIARLDATGESLERVDTDVAELVRSRVADFVPLARARRLTVELVAPDELLFSINPDGLKSVVDNLVDNAIRYTPDGGAVHVTLAHTETGLLLSVKDDGPGVPHEYRTRLFERFFRIPGETAEGSGLGLAIVSRVAAFHSASVEISSGLNDSGLGITVHVPCLARYA